MAQARVFVALGLGAELGAWALDEVRAALGGELTRWRLPRAAGLHLTLAFLGDVEREALGPLAAALEGHLTGAAAPQLVLRGAGAFPRRGAERVLWLGADEPAAEGRLAELHRRTLAGVEAGLGAAGIELPRELRGGGRPFRPHVTVARPKRPPGRAPEAFFGLASGRTVAVEEATLFESVRAPSGPPVYEPRATFALDG